MTVSEQVSSRGGGLSVTESELCIGLSTGSLRKQLKLRVIATIDGLEGRKVMTEEEGCLSHRIFLLSFSENDEAKVVLLNMINLGWSLIAVGRFRYFSSLLSGGRRRRRAISGRLYCASRSLRWIGRVAGHLLQCRDNIVGYWRARVRAV